MPYIPVPKDLTRVKPKFLFNLTKRQLVCFGGGALVGIPLFFLLKGPLGNSSAAICMIVVMMPFFLFALYEKNGLPLEKYLLYFVQVCFIRPRQRPYINYLRTRETFRAYKASGYSKRYLAEHEQEILLHRAAKKAFNDRGLKKLPTVKALQAEYAALLAGKRATYPAYREARAEMKKLLTYRANAEAILGMNANTGKRQKEHEHR